MRFFVGMDDVANTRFLGAVFLSVNRLTKRKSDFSIGDWIMDSGAFTEVSTHGGYRNGVEEYASQINRWKRCGNLLGAVAQDFMCEPWIVAKTGLSIAEHQRLTIERYDALRPLTEVYIMPVLQGYQVDDYISHLRAYSPRLAFEQWVGVGSICKRNGRPDSIHEILAAIKKERPDLRLHGFGLKTTALRDTDITDLLHTADSMAWSFAARKQGRNAHDWREAQRFVDRIETQKQTAQRRLAIV